VRADVKNVAMPVFFLMARRRVRERDDIRVVYPNALGKAIVRVPKLGNNGNRESEGVRRDTTFPVAAPP
jgi:hypothetical protein